ncbi:MAG: glycosyltransferase family 9 protein [Planctomycetota bacterium]|jgi:heptosyltransferase-3
MALRPFKRPPRRVLLWATPGFGDVLILTPLIRSVRRAWPDAAIDVIVHRGREAMLEGNPDVRRAIPIPKHPNPLQFLGIWLRLLGRYDLTMHAVGSERAMFLLRSAGRRCVAILAPTGFNEMWRRAVASAWLPTPVRSTPFLLRHLRLADAVGIERSYEMVPPFDPSSGERLDRLLEFDWRSEPYAVLHPATHATRKRWTVEGWHALGRRLGERGWRCVLTGGPKEDLAYLETIRSGVNGITVAGELSLANVRTLVEHAQAYVGVDTSTTHLAAAVGVPTVAIYGPGPTNRWAPWPHGYADATPPFEDVRGVATNGNVCLIQADCECGWDYRHGCGKTIPGRSRCLEELSTDFVVGAVERFLSRALRGG